MYLLMYNIGLISFPTGSTQQLQYVLWWSETKLVHHVWVREGSNGLQ